MIFAVLFDANVLVAEHHKLCFAHRMPHAPPALNYLNFWSVFMLWNLSAI